MDPVEQIGSDVKMRVEGLGTEIIRFAEEKGRAGSAGLSEAEQTEKIEAARNVLKQKMDVVFGDQAGSISFDIQQVLETGKDRAGAGESQAPDVSERTRKAAAIWLEELPGLRQFLEYCAGMIEEHPGKISPEVRESQKCITEAAVVLAAIAERVARELPE